MKRKIILYSVLALLIILASMFTAFMPVMSTEAESPVSAMVPLAGGAALLEYSVAPAEDVNVTAGLFTGVTLTALLVVVSTVRKRTHDNRKLNLSYGFGSGKFYALLTHGKRCLRSPLKFILAMPA